MSSSAGTTYRPSEHSRRGPIPRPRRAGSSPPRRALELDFRVGGRERSRGTAPDGNAFSYEALYQDIVPAERIVYTYDMHLQETRISVSLATVEFRPVGGNGTRLVFTEQGAFLDGHEFPARRAEGWGSLLDALEKAVQSEAPGA